MTPTEALHYLTKHAMVPIHEVVEANIAYETLRKLVIDEVARRKNTAETERIVKS